MGNIQTAAHPQKADKFQRGSPLPMKTSYCSLFLLCLIPSGVFATEYPDLKRMEPVPATSQIPIIDFVRPELFRDVRLNHTGTHVGMIAPDENDHLNLFTYNLATHDFLGVATPAVDSDISDFIWLEGSRLVYLMTQKKFIGRQLLLTDA